MNSIDGIFVSVVLLSEHIWQKRSGYNQWYFFDVCALEPMKRFHTIIIVM